MSRDNFSESVVEQATLAWLEALGYTILSGPEIAPGEPAAERKNYEQVVLESRLRQALQRLNPDIPADALEEAFRKLEQKIKDVKEERDILRKVMDTFSKKPK